MQHDCSLKVQQGRARYHPEVHAARSLAEVAVQSKFAVIQRAVPESCAEALIIALSCVNWSISPRRLLPATYGCHLVLPMRLC
jgi:hypothetical protein